MAGFPFGVGWRARRLVRAYDAYYAQPWRALERAWTNARIKSADRPVAYVYAEPMNAGDYASYRGIRLLVGRPGAEYFAGRHFAARTVRALSRPPAPGRKWSAVIVGGGGLLQEAFNPLWEGLTSLDTPLVVFGVGINRYQQHRRGTPDDLLRRIAARATIIRLRDQMSAARFEEVTGRRPSVGICTAVNYLRSLPFSRPAGRGHLLHAVHVSDLSASPLSLVALRQRLMQLAEALGLGYEETDHVGGLTPRLLAHYHRAAVVVSSRLHGCIFALAHQVPFVAIGLDDKVAAFVDTHARFAPLLTASDAMERLDERLVATTWKAGVPIDVDALCLDNQQAMSDALRAVGLNTSDG